MFAFARHLYSIHVIYNDNFVKIKMYSSTEYYFQLSTLCLVLSSNTRSRHLVLKTLLNYFFKSNSKEFYLLSKSISFLPMLWSTLNVCAFSPFNIYQSQS